MVSFFQYLPALPRPTRNVGRRLKFRSENYVILEFGELAKVWKCTRVSCPASRYPGNGFVPVPEPVEGLLGRKSILCVDKVFVILASGFLFKHSKGDVFLHLKLIRP